ncbi:SDR family NAD(P)-dependent oxidoreductase [Clostridium estertheticum]|uniref:SDR family NAD(P)-dependent oxidoreductase n=1 Tax=Clostridium estertheticum TaxID=238834 RepID=UPI001C7D470B|nr:SDR family oxidoreductase [Clostridium estertheticum]MBX4271801.1 SDR family oxidoreductase [Clostridium estertheticum]WLC82283.1 SDR family oxidoreductase [Clostridium estertheticum]
MKGYVLITGATSGLGYEFSKILAKEGYNLILVGRRKDKLNEVSEELIRRYQVYVRSYVVDLSKDNEIEKLCKEVDLLQIEILINNAGFNVYGEFTTTDLKKEEEMIWVNIISLTKLTKIIGKKMVEMKKGKIMNIGSIGSYIPGPLNSVYCATKSYVLSFSQALNEELKASGVTVTTICPGATNTNFAKSANMESIQLFNNNVMEVTAVANLAYKALDKGKVTEIIGLKNKLTVLVTKFIPLSLTLKVASKMMR